MDEAYVQLNRLVVEARNANAYSDKTVYRPSAQQKRAANTATDLLRFIAIPQIKVNLINNTVTDNVGTNVQIFINGIEASSEELQGLPTADVRTVEYLEFPTDPRFKGAERAINFIVQDYAYGGYTKVSADENFLVGLASHANIFSKFNYKKMSYDLYVGANNYNNHHKGSSSTTRFLLTDEGKEALVTGEEGKEAFVTRDEKYMKSHYESNEYPITFRATYNTDKIQIRNTVGYTYDAVPTYEYAGKVQYSDNRGENVDFHHRNPSTTNIVAYSGSYYFSLPNKFSIDVTPSFNYSHINDCLTYNTSDYSDIVRHARENAYFYRVNAYLRKTLNQNHSLMFGANGGNQI
ncbi:MAG: hypothetical protein K2J78_08045, partial [Muribaculaceae bacterium]|nr:hypothetical protein [Muribaculaceae bacterium]